MSWYTKLHWQIIIGLVLGLIFGVIAAAMGGGGFVANWVAPFGTIFLNLLKLIAVPLILVSLITGVASLSDIRKLSRIGGKTIAIYLSTTVVALVIGLTLVNLIRPGDGVPEEMKVRLQAMYEGDVEQRQTAAAAAATRGPLQPLVDMVPENAFGAMAGNQNMLQVVFFALFAGVALLLIPNEKARPVLEFCDSVNDLIIKMVDIIMLAAPVGVFALLASTITAVARDDLRQVIELVGALGLYCLTVLLGLMLHMATTYVSLLRLFTPLGVMQFFRGIAPALLVGFSTSSSGATLPVTKEMAERHLGISEEVSSFVLPLGATINMDGTALYQAVAAVFIAQALGMGLDFGAQITIVFTAVLASIGTAAVPGAGIVMLVIILEAIGVPTQGIALILGVDRILDMCRTVTNITGDATVAAIVAATEGSLGAPIGDAEPQES
jgi:Na+/H+-dicarboxylate symporter